MRTASQIARAIFSPETLLVALLAVVVVGLGAFAVSRLPDFATIGDGFHLGFDVGIALGVAVGGLLSAAVGLGVGLLASYHAVETVTRRTARILGRMVWRSTVFVVGLLVGYLVAAGAGIPLVNLPGLMLAVGAGVVVGALIGTYGAMLPALFVATLIALPFGLGLRALAGRSATSAIGVIALTTRAILLNRLAGSRSSQTESRVIRRVLLLDDHQLRRMLLTADLETRDYVVDAVPFSWIDRVSARGMTAVVAAVPPSTESGAQSAWDETRMAVAKLNPPPSTKVIYLSSEPELRHVGHPLSATVVSWSGDPAVDLDAVVGAVTPASRMATQSLISRINTTLRTAARTATVASGKARRQRALRLDDQLASGRYVDGRGYVQSVDALMLGRVDGVLTALRLANPSSIIQAALLRSESLDHWALTLVSLDDATTSPNSLDRLTNGRYRRVLEVRVVGWDGYAAAIAPGALRVFEAPVAEFPLVTDLVSDGARLSTEKRYDEALSYFDKALAVNPRSSWAWYERGHVLRLTGATGAALVSYRVAAELGEPVASEFVGDCARKLGIGQLPSFKPLSS